MNSCTVTNFGDQKSRKWLRRAKREKDVYKRQALGSMPPVSTIKNSWPFHSQLAKIRSRLMPGVSSTMARRWPHSLLNRVDSVSYTHLDVYKRQVPQRPFWWCEACGRQAF